MTKPKPIYLAAELHRKIKLLALRLDTTITAIIYDAVQDYLKKHGK